MTDAQLLNLGAWSVQAAVLAVAAIVADRMLRVDSPAARYAWWRIVLLACLALPVLQPWRAQPAGLDANESEVVSEAAVSPAPAVASAPLRTPSARPFTPPVASILGIVLLIGVLVRLAWLVAGLFRLRRIRRRGVAVGAIAESDAFQPLIESGADVRFVTSLRQPVTFGIRRTVVLLPLSLQTMSAGVQRAVLVHELWHVKRRDWLWNLLEEIVCSVFWFHPAIWYLVSRVQCAREEVVDERSVRSTGARRTYLEALLAFADEAAVYPAAPFIRRRQLFNRMMLISREGVMSPKRIVASSAAMLGALLVAGWYGVLAFPLTVDAPAGADSIDVQQPRDPRADAPRPATSREQELKTATTADPSNVKNWLTLAKLQEERSATAEAEATYQAALTATAGNRDVLVSMAGFFNRSGQFDKTVAVLEDLAARDPTDPNGHQLVATFYWEKAQKDKSLTPADKLMYLESGIRATDRAIALKPDYVEALTYKNILLRMKANQETDPTHRQTLVAEADALRNRAIELSKQRRPAVSDPNAPPPPPPPPPPVPADYYKIDGQQAARVGGDVKTPTKVMDAAPEYPAQAKAAGISGLVIVEVVIDTQGTVRAARVLRSVPGLDEAAIAAAKQWKFTPAIRDGVAVPVVMTVPVNFTPQQ